MNPKINKIITLAKIWECVCDFTQLANLEWDLKVYNGVLFWLFKSHVRI